MIQQVARELTPDLSQMLSLLQKPIKILWESWWESDLAERNPPIIIVAGLRSSVMRFAPKAPGTSPLVAAIMPRKVLVQCPELDPPDVEQVLGASYESTIPVVVICDAAGWSLVELHPVPAAKA